MHAKLEPAGFFRRIPLAPHQLQVAVTPTQDMIVLCHLGVPHLAADAHRLEVAGLVENPLALSLGDLQTFEKAEVESVHQCAGSPLQPTQPTRRICNVRWGGVRLRDVLRRARPTAAATHIWCAGADHGSFADVSVEAYVKDLPLAEIGPDVLLAWEVNGAALPRENGYPLRLVVPGFYGTNSVKWLNRIELQSRRCDSPFTTRWYNDPVLDADGRDTGLTKPVWRLAPEAVIVSPAPGSVLRKGAPALVEGWAWGGGGIATVEISTDDGASWASAQVDPASGYRWQRFSQAWTPAATGPLRLIAKATSRDGTTQPRDGARNAWHVVDVDSA